MSIYWNIERKHEHARELVRKFKKFGEAKTAWRDLIPADRDRCELIRVETYPGVPSIRHVLEHTMRRLGQSS